VTATATPAFNVCTFVPSSAVAASFGGTVTSTASGTFLADSPLCNYGVRASNLGLDGTVQVIDLTIWNSTMYADWVANRKSPKAVQVPGVGEDAWYTPEQTSVLLHRGNTVYFVGALFRPPAGTALDAGKVKADTEALAKSVAGLL